MNTVNYLVAPVNSSVLVKSFQISRQENTLYCGCLQSSGNKV